MPVFNAASYLHEAIDSVINQTFPDWELICIDDGSMDESGSILDDYAAKDKRIRVHHQDNHGVSFSRQRGVDDAKGEYCAHLDSDDWLEPAFLEEMLSKAKQTDADIVWCDMFVNSDGLWPYTCEENPSAMIKKILLQEIWGSLCNKLVRTSICKRDNVRFPDGCAMWEDMAFCIQCLLHSTKLVYINAYLYHYRQIQSSLTHQNSTRIMTYEYQKAVDIITEKIDESGRYYEFEKELKRLKLFVIKDYIDDLRIRDYKKFSSIYPDAYAHIQEYSDIPNRLKISTWLINHRMSFFVPVVFKLDAIKRKLYS